MTDWDDPLDPANPLAPAFWSEWVCPDCGEDGSRDELADGRRCPQCGSEVEQL